MVACIINFCYPVKTIVQPSMSCRTLLLQDSPRLDSVFYYFLTTVQTAVLKKKRNIKHCYFLSPVSFKIKKRERERESGGKFCLLRSRLLTPLTSRSASGSGGNRNTGLSFYHGEQLCVASSLLCGALARRGSEAGRRFAGEKPSKLNGSIQIKSLSGLFVAVQLLNYADVLVYFFFLLFLSAAPTDFAIVKCDPSHESPN